MPNTSTAEDVTAETQALHNALRQRAADAYGSDDVTFNDDAPVIEADDGASVGHWVQAWVWLPADRAEPDDGAPIVTDVVSMPCADEAFAVRSFALVGSASLYSGPPDYVCSHCGWLQTSAQAGARELLNCATWDSDEARREFIAAAERAIPGFTPAD